MKAFAAALAVLSVAAFCYQVSSSPNAVHVSGPCCLRYISREIPLSRVKAYEPTQSHCPQPAYHETPGRPGRQAGDNTIATASIICSRQSALTNPS
uniref:C-C motif chemokine 4 homolog n=1 Tax=Nothoprocta perdicaria TaxID=30464 RepID=A0A8C6YWF6_NOTPE